MNKSVYQQLYSAVRHSKIQLAATSTHRKESVASITTFAADQQNRVLNSEGQLIENPEQAYTSTSKINSTPGICGEIAKCLLCPLIGS